MMLRNGGLQLLPELVLFFLSRDPLNKADVRNERCGFTLVSPRTFLS